MPRRDSRRLSPAVRAVLRSASKNPNRHCSLPWRLAGAPRAALLLSLSRRGLVQVWNWSTEGDACAAGSVIGKLTPEGSQALTRGPRR